MAEVSFNQNKLAQIAAPVGGIVQTVDVDLGGAQAAMQSAHTAGIDVRDGAVPHHMVHTVQPDPCGGIGDLAAEQVEGSGADHFCSDCPMAGQQIAGGLDITINDGGGKFHRADLRRRGIDVISVHPAEAAPDGAMDYIVEALFDWKNEQSLDDMARDVRRGLRANVVAGYAPGGFPTSAGVRQSAYGGGTSANGQYSLSGTASNGLDYTALPGSLAITAGNVAATDEIGSIAYGLAHVNTPVLVILGHTHCGAVTAVSQAVGGHGHKLERNIPPLVDNIIPAVKRAMDQHKDVHGAAIVPFAIEENVWQGVEDLFMKSPAVRNLVKAGNVRVVGAIYDLGTGKVDWLPQAKIEETLQRVEASPDKETEPFAK